MTTTHLLLIILPFLPFAQPSTIDQKTVNPDLTARLKTAATNRDRHALLPTNEDWTFDFTAHPSYNDPVGSVITANAATFPAIVDVGMTVAILNMGPCSMLPPHFHQRATNVVTALKGNTTTWMINENGVRTVTVNLTPGKMTVFPAGSLHAMQNNNCEPSQLHSALNSDDAGTLNVVNGLWSLPAEMVQAGFGDADLEVETLGKKIPEVGTGVNPGVAECRKRCGITHGKK